MNVCIKIESGPGRPAWSTMQYFIVGFSRANQGCPFTMQLSIIFYLCFCIRKQKNYLIGSAKPVIFPIWNRLRHCAFTRYDQIGSLLVLEAKYTLKKYYDTMALNTMIFLSTTKQTHSHTFQA